MSEKTNKLKLHPIKLLSIDVKELWISLRESAERDQDIDSQTATIVIGRTEYDEKESSIQVGIKLEVGTEEDQKEIPFSMRIELIGTFKIDKEKFPIEHVNDWADKNAPYILFPYLREHAFALTTRCGLKPMLLPLVEVPTFSIRPKKRKK